MASNEIALERTGFRLPLRLGTAVAGLAIAAGALLAMGGLSADTRDKAVGQSANQARPEYLNVKPSADQTVTYYVSAHRKRRRACST